ncbi:coiled-coil domain-containing protein 55-domain containing protein [Dunaliella salina]|uniref:Coiled-coil domain-containing protein 55-domain containing protein n=1 Tax=Dunaliella salina TaxID=3046 RepID=A0ABQ7G6M7_DUNSA|nr:coiled-coil domain-containing protein 55-domain containing protein [Dunaliella salina]|eukprot:KAF5830258.1 coiled-coil domain-containing protein 55-domain containing protein [Dunaliella salina]
MHEPLCFVLQVARQAEKKRSAAKVQQTYEDALAQDPSVFDYDGVYDSIQASRTLPKQQEKIDRKSRYIAQLKEQAEHRKREEEVRFERRLLKERQQEDHLFEGKDKFITSAYRKKLEEDKKWVEVEKQKEAEEEANDVRKVGHMGNFYANLLTKNVALGTAAPPTKPKEAEKPLAHPQAGAEVQDEEQRLAAAAATALQQKRQQQQHRGPPLDKYEQARRDAELALRQQRDGGAEPAEEESTAGLASSGQREERQPASVPPSIPLPAQGAAAQHPAGATEGAGVAAEGAAGAGTGAAVPVGGKRRNDDAAVMGAKERYLARKKQLTGS